MHASLVWSDLNAAAIIRGAVHLLHHVFLTILFGIFFVGCRSARAIVQSHVQGNAHWARPGHDRAQFATGKWWDGGYLPLVARITVGRGDFGEGTNAIVSRVVGFEMLRSPFGYIEAYAAGSCDCHCHCAKAGVAIAAEMATTATNILDLVMISLLPGRPHHRAADMERERSLRLRIPGGSSRSGEAAVSSARNPHGGSYDS
jgi:hypothetical protein